MKRKAVIVGDGTIGDELWARLTGSPDWDISYVLTSKRRMTPHQSTGDTRAFTEVGFDSSDSDALKEILAPLAGGMLFLCIPTKDQGEAAFRYADIAIGAGMRVVTAEKGMAAWQFPRIRPYLGRIDLGAAVGGGNRFPYTMLARDLSQKRVLMHAVLNATLNFIFSEVNDGRSLEDAVDHASKIGIAEPLKPGEVLNPIALVNGELRDVAMKICALFNFALADDEYIRPDVFGDVQIGEDELSRLLSANDFWRFVITITNQDRHVDRENDIIAHMKATVGDRHISAGFKKIRGGPLARWLPAVGGINNGILLTEGSHTYSFGGPGAGFATVDAMLIGARRLLVRSQQAELPSSRGDKQQSG